MAGRLTRCNKKGFKTIRRILNIIDLKVHCSFLLCSRGVGRLLGGGNIWIDEEKGQVNML